MKKNNRREILIYSCIIVVQIIFLIYWANVKTNFFIDDLYSFGYAGGFTGEGDNARYITKSPEFGFNKWISNAEFKKYLILDDDEKIFNTSFMNAASRLLTGRTYFGLLNIAESIAGYSYVTSGPAVVLNIILFVLAEIMLILLMKKTGMDTRTRYLELIMFGCSTYVISAAEYIRFYILVILFLILMLMCLYDFWRADTWRKTILTALGMGVLAYFSYKNTELAIPYFGGLVLSILIVSVFAGKRKQLVTSAGILLTGTFYILLTTDFVGVILHPDNYDAKTAGVALTAGTNINNMTADTLISFLTWAIKLFGSHYFGNYRIVLLFFGVVIVYLLLKTEKKENISINKIRPTGSLVRSIKLHLGAGVGYILIITGATAIYTVFTAAAGYGGVWRYYVYGFISVTVIIWYAVDRILKSDAVKKYSKPLFRIMAVFALVSALIPFKERKVEYMYEDEKAFLSAVQSNKDKDVVLFTFLNQNGETSRHEIYDCINLMSENSDIYVVDLDKYEYDSVDFPDEFILWSHLIKEVDEEKADLKAHGYEIEELGTDHCSRACVCRKID